MQRRIIGLKNAAIASAASVVGKNEREGPLGECFDIYDQSDKFGMKTWEKAESEMQRLALTTALAKASVSEREIGALFAGDLLNQCVGSAYGLLEFDIPYFGLYGACSTAIEGLTLASLLVDTGVFEVCAAATSSHYCSAERQYRTPLEYGSQRSPLAQWTVTGAGAFIVSRGGRVRIREALPGIVIEKGITEEMAKVLPMKRQALHAFEMDFSKVFDGLKFRAPLQEDFKKFMDDHGIVLPEKFSV